MVSTAVHLAFAGLLAAALLGPYYDRRGVLIVFAATVFPDLDSFIAPFFVVGHRTVLHTYLVPIAIGVVLLADTRLREESFVRENWGSYGVAVGWVSLLAWAVAGIGLDFVGAGVNPLWPLHDQFYTLNGKVELSDQRGIVQTFVDLSPDEGGVPAPDSRGSSQEVNVSTGIDPDPSNTNPDPNPERVFPVVRAGWQLLVLVVGTSVTAARFRLPYRE
ncbi:MAG: metal-dependent hydrolase [Haloarculaceae archaeon]